VLEEDLELKIEEVWIGDEFVSLSLSEEFFLMVLTLFLRKSEEQQQASKLRKGIRKALLAKK
jgi:hypothetical protein